MIKINDKNMSFDELSQLISNNEQKKTIKQMSTYSTVYKYESINHLKFEMVFRMNTIKAAKDLNKSGAKFTTFFYSKCNPRYWNRLTNGGFQMKSTVSPSIAIMDIIRNGSQYAFECSTAIAIVLYIAALYSIGANGFNNLFGELYLMDWQFDEDFIITTHQGEDFIPGDVLHFKNPDFDPKQPHWQAENVIYFGDDTYYGHGIGIRNANKFIGFLNKKRKPNPMASAFLMNLITRPHYLSLYFINTQS